MSEENIKRIEKKVDLLYKILLELHIDYDFGGQPYNQDYINSFMDELIPLFGLSVEEIEIERLPTQKEINELKSGLETELNRLKRIYESGNFLAKEENKIKNKIEEITEYLRCWDYDWDCYSSGIVAPEFCFKSKEEITNKNKQIYERSLFVGLKKKLGLDVGNAYAYIPHEEDYNKGYESFTLIEKRDTLKKNLKDFIEKIRRLGEE